MKQAIRRFDLVCLGGGPAAIPCARKAAAYGKKVCIIEKDELGGTCLNRGCTPKKIVHHALELHYDVTRAGEYGIWTPNKRGSQQSNKQNEMTIDWPTLQGMNQGFVKMINQMVGKMCDMMHIHLLRGKGKLVSPNAIEVMLKDGSVTVEGEHILVATGAHSTTPKIPGIELAQNSDYFFKSQTLPQSVAIVGGGYIGVELANAYSGLGVPTSLLMLGDSILPSFDPELAAAQMKGMMKRGIVVYPKTELASISRGNGQDLVLNTKNPQHPKVESHCVLVAVGRSPNTRDLGLEKVGVKLGPTNEILVDEYDATNIPNIHAIGDVNGKVMLTTVARTASKLLADRLFGPGQAAKADFKMDYKHVPTAVFGSPPMARCGMTEAEAIAVYGKNNVKTYKHEGFHLAHALIAEKEPLIYKMVCAQQGKDEVVVGIHGLGRHVDEAIVGFSLALKKGLTKADIMRAVAVHPTGAEEIFNLF